MNYAELPALAAQHRDALAEEMADIAILITYLAQDLNVDLETAVREKLVKNATKYPVEKAKGVATKYDPLSGRKFVQWLSNHWMTRRSNACLR